MIPVELLKEAIIKAQLKYDKRAVKEKAAKVERLRKKIRKENLKV